LFDVSGICGCYQIDKRLDCLGLLQPPPLQVIVVPLNWFGARHIISLGIDHEGQFSARTVYHAAGINKACCLFWWEYNG